MVSSLGADLFVELRRGTCILIGTVTVEERVHQLAVAGVFIQLGWFRASSIISNMIGLLE